MRLGSGNLTHADDAVAGMQVLAGQSGTFNVGLAQKLPRAILSPNSRVAGGTKLPGRGNNRFHFGAVNGRFSTVGLVALAVVAAGLYFALKK